MVNLQAPSGDSEAFRASLRGRLYPLIAEAYTSKMQLRDFKALCAEIYRELLKKKTAKDK